MTWSETTRGFTRSASRGPGSEHRPAAVLHLGPCRVVDLQRPKRSARHHDGGGRLGGLERHVHDAVDDESGRVSMNIGRRRRPAGSPGRGADERASCGLEGLSRKSRCARVTSAMRRTIAAGSRGVTRDGRGRRTYSVDKRRDAALLFTRERVNRRIHPQGGERSWRAAGGRSSSQISSPRASWRPTPAPGGPGHGAGDLAGGQGARGALPPDAGRCCAETSCKRS